MDFVGCLGSQECDSILFNTGKGSLSAVVAANARNSVKEVNSFILTQDARVGEILSCEMIKIRC